jgi:hypothetical protein
MTGFERMFDGLVIGEGSDARAIKHNLELTTPEFDTETNFSSHFQLC